MAEYNENDYEQNLFLESMFIEGVTTIDNGEFMGLKNLENVIISDDVKKIGSNAFSGCKKLKKVKFPKSLQEIGLGAFHGCEKLQSVILHDSIQSIGWGAFENCWNLKEISLPISAKLDYNAFKNISEDAVVQFRLNGENIKSIDLHDSDLFNNIYLSKDNSKLIFAKKKVQKLEKSCFKIKESALNTLLNDEARKLYIAMRYKDIQSKQGLEK